MWSVESVKNALWSKGIKYGRYAIPNDTSNLAFFPSLPIRRSRGFYKADKQGKKEHRKCQKKGKGQHTLLPGIFTVFCQQGNFNFI